MDTIARYAYNAGFRGVDLVTAVAVAYAESGGDIHNYNPETAAGTPIGKGSYGLWQIYLKAHPEFEGWDLYDPATNARAAYHVWQTGGRSFRPWSTYQHGSQLKFITRAAAEVAALGTGLTSGGLNGWIAVTLGIGAAIALWQGTKWWSARHEAGSLTKP